MQFKAPMPKFPCWLYHDKHKPRVVYNTAEEEQARFEGFDHVNASMMSNKSLVNWFWDFEDMSPRQLQVYAQEEYGVDLPIEAGQEKLFQAVTELTRHAPQNRNRLVLMAHTISMKYDATLEEIRRLVENPGDANVENIYEEFTA
ncbi:MAG: hypothetical protein V3V37_08730 [Candidatus Adiutricales bacterium]